MFDWIVVDVVKVPVEVIQIANGVFPEAALPDTARSLPPARSRLGFFDAVICKIHAREIRFDIGNPDREIGVTFRKRHEDMQVVWE